MSKLCKNVALVLACLMAGAASVQAKTRPVEAVASQPAPYYNPSLYCHNVTLSYGVISNYGIKRMFQGLFPALQESMYDEGIRMGAVTFGYTYDLSSKLSVGGMFSYAGALGTIAAIPTTWKVRMRLPGFWRSRARFGGRRVQGRSV